MSSSVLLFSDHNGIRLESSNRYISVKSPSIWKLNNTVLNNLWIKAEKRETFELNKNVYTIFQNLWETGETVLRGKFMVLKMPNVKKRRGLKSVISALMLRN